MTDILAGTRQKPGRCLDHHLGLDNVLLRIPLYHVVNLKPHNKYSLSARLHLAATLALDIRLCPVRPGAAS